MKLAKIEFGLAVLVADCWGLDGASWGLARPTEAR